MRQPPVKRTTSLSKVISKLTLLRINEYLIIQKVTLKNYVDNLKLNK